MILFKKKLNYKTIENSDSDRTAAMERTPNDYVDDWYEYWMDQVIDYVPLRPASDVTRVDNAARVNQHLVSSIYHIRRFLEIDAERVRRRRERQLREDLVSQIMHYMSTPTSNIVEDLLSTLVRLVVQEGHATEYEDVKVTLSEEQFLKLPQSVLTKQSALVTDGGQCNICMDTYQGGDVTVQLPCDHVFHCNCIQHWLCVEKVTCPVCRADTRTSQ